MNAIFHIFEYPAREKMKVSATEFIASLPYISTIVILLADINGKKL